ncbi:MAG: heme A synthase, partial [Alphaproteobacteria bacterium]|nr:heme A synthase [Alphaproteobacteria bacterium]
MAEKRKLFEEVGATAQVTPQGGLIEGKKGARRGIRAWLVTLFLLVAMM